MNYSSILVSGESFSGSTTFPYVSLFEWLSNFTSPFLPFASTFIVVFSCVLFLSGPLSLTPSTSAQLNLELLVLNKPYTDQILPSKQKIRNQYTLRLMRRFYIKIMQNEFKHLKFSYFRSFYGSQLKLIEAFSN